MNPISGVDVNHGFMEANSDDANDYLGLWDDKTRLVCQLEKKYVAGYTWQL